MKKGIIGIIAVGLFTCGLCALGMLYSGCGGTIQKPTSAQIDEAAFLGCAAIKASTDCLDSPEIQEAFPGLAPENCGERISYLIELATDATKIKDANSAFVVLSEIDLDKVNYFKLLGLKNARCKVVKDALGL